MVCFNESLYLLQVLQKLLKYYLQRRDKVLLFSLSTKVGTVFMCIEITVYSLSLTLHIYVHIRLRWN